MYVCRYMIVLYVIVLLMVYYYYFYYLLLYVLPQLLFLSYTDHIYCPKIFKSKPLVYKTRKVMTLQDTNQQVSPLLVCYHAKPSVDLDTK